MLHFPEYQVCREFTRRLTKAMCLTWLWKQVIARRKPDPGSSTPPGDPGLGTTVTWLEEPWPCRLEAMYGCPYGVHSRSSFILNCSNLLGYRTGFEKATLLLGMTMRAGDICMMLSPCIFFSGNSVFLCTMEVLDWNRRKAGCFLKGRGERGRRSASGSPFPSW